MSAIQGRDAWSLGELRTVTVIFVHLPTLDCNFNQNREEKLNEINRVLREMQEIVSKYQGLSSSSFWQKQKKNKHFHNFWMTFKTSLFSLLQTSNILTGMIRQFVIDDKGSVLIVVFGCPGAAHEDDSFRAIMVALTIQGRLHEPKKQSTGPEGELIETSAAHICSIGITTGSAFCGIVGQHGKGLPQSFFVFSFFFVKRVLLIVFLSFFVHC